MNIIKKLKLNHIVILGRIFILSILLFLGIALIYGLMTLLGAVIPVNQGRRTPSEGKFIYLVNNGYHIALVLPRDSCPYPETFDTPLNLTGKGGYFYFGWGDRQFYLGTPTVLNIDWSMAVKALFIPSSSVLEVLYLHTISPELPGVTSLVVTNDELKNLYQYIKAAIMESEKMPEQILFEEIDQAFQGSIFFEANGSYSLFNTCNNWTSKGLNQAGINTHLWTPFTWGVK
ncbi:MAG: DUF2459 domain-containing protein [Spirochaetia bacterium]|jgi:uncharacterized protein (TIGR02117 family)|nr:DUF2459 domain-containing protein [Spirochaetia bacterium]